MSRVRFAAKIIAPLEPKSILDVGCRDAELAIYLPNAEYHGADLFPGERVTYIGDITRMTIDRSFDAVVACDILEHLDDPSLMFDRLLPLAERHFLISLPNTYGLKSIAGMIRGDMGGKYRFTEEAPQDRHRWLMGRAEIHAFARAKAKKHRLALELFDLTYGSSGNQTMTAIGGRMLSALLPRRFTTDTVFALFSR
ncbi:MAG TPA: class I SAM-dependent methyltransferase [Sphingomicrobium sp.]